MMPSADLSETPEQRIALLRSTLEAVGVVFTNGNKPGVKLRKASK